MNSGVNSRVSVVVPLFNAAPYIVATLDSIAAQSTPPLEIVIIDDGSNDGSFEVAQNWKSNAASNIAVHLERQSNSGPAAARNAGLHIASGGLIAFLDADDLWPHKTLEMQTSLLRETRQGRSDSIVMGLTQAFEKNSVGEMVMLGEPFRFLNVGSALFPMDAFEKCGEFAVSLRASEDVDWFLRARDLGFNLLSHQTVTLWHRRHETNMTRGQSLLSLDFHSALKRSLDRRRALGLAHPKAPFEKGGSA